MDISNLDRRIALLNRRIQLAIDNNESSQDLEIPKSMQRYNLYHTIVIGDWRQRLIARLIYWLWL